MPLVGTVPVRISNRPAVTVTDMSYDFAGTNNVRLGGYGPIGTSKSGRKGTGSFKMVPRQETGPEFDLALFFEEFTVAFPVGTKRYQLLGCESDKESLSVQQEAGNTEFTISFTFTLRKQTK